MKPSRPLASLYLRLRTEGTAPVPAAGAVGLGAFIGAFPVFGTHLPLCWALATLLRLNPVLAYLAANLNNPLTLPVFLYLEYGTGSLLLHGRWPELTLAAAGELRLAEAGRSLLLGFAVVGSVLGLAAAVVAYALRRRRGAAGSFAEELRDLAASPYLACGIPTWEYVRGKLDRDPVYLELLRSGILPQRGRLLDLGCGRGIALRLLQAASRLRRLGRWPAGWPAPPANLRLVGVERRRSSVRAAAAATDGGASLLRADLACLPLPPAAAILLLDVLHYLPAPRQEDLVRRAAAALQPDGVLLIREVDADRGARAWAARLGERLASLFRGVLRPRFHYRAAAGWEDLLREAGLAASTRPMWGGTPFANVLIEGRAGRSRLQ